jgi:hypothetical protein
LSIFSDSSRFSNTVWARKMVGFWNLRPMPASTISASDIRVRSCASPYCTSPVSGRVRPVMTSINVVLPAPFGPMTQRSSPGSTMRLSESRALKPSKVTVTPLR